MSSATFRAGDEWAEYSLEDVAMTDTSTTDTEGHSFQQKAAGQVAPAGCVLKPAHNGHHRQISFDISPERHRERAKQARPGWGKVSRLEGLDRVLNHVVLKCKGACFTSRSVNLAVRNLRYTTNSGKSAKEITDKVITRLVEGGLAEDVEVTRGRGSGMKGPKVRTCHWKAWPAITGDPASDAFRCRLALEPDDFA